MEKIRSKSEEMRSVHFRLTLAPKTSTLTTTPHPHPKSPAPPQYRDYQSSRLLTNPHPTDSIPTTRHNRSITTQDSSAPKPENLPLSAQYVCVNLPESTGRFSRDPSIAKTSSRTPHPGFECIGDLRHAMNNKVWDRGTAVSGMRVYLLLMGIELALGGCLRIGVSTEGAILVAF